MSYGRNGHAKKLGIGESRLRAWEDSGVQPFKPEDGPLYELAAELILAAKEGGMSTQRIREVMNTLLPAPPPANEPPTSEPVRRGEVYRAARMYGALSGGYGPVEQSIAYLARDSRKEHAEVMGALQGIGRSLATIAAALERKS